MPITGTQHPTSPQISRLANDSRVYVRRFQYARDYDWEAEMPAVGSLDGTYGYFRGYTSQNGPAYVMVELTYDTEGGSVNFSPGDGDTEYWAETQGVEQPIEYNPNYLTKWNYGLWSKADGDARTIAADFPGGSAAYNAATDLSALAGSAVLLWSKADPGAEWIMLAGRTKAADFYISPQRSVMRRDYHRQQSAAEADLESVGTIMTPAETFGAAGGSWLVMFSNTTFDGRYWVTETQFLHSPEGWDTDIY